MTRYEVEEIANHVLEVEDSLEQWAIDTKEMEVELAALDRMIHWLDKQIAQEYEDGELKAILPQLEQKARDCSDCIKKRLSTRW